MMINPDDKMNELCLDALKAVIGGSGARMSPETVRLLGKVIDLSDEILDDVIQDLGDTVYVTSIAFGVALAKFAAVNHQLQDKDEVDNWFTSLLAVMSACSSECYDTLTQEDLGEGYAYLPDGCWPSSGSNENN